MTGAARCALLGILASLAIGAGLVGESHAGVANFLLRDVKVNSGIDFTNIDTALTGNELSCINKNLPSRVEQVICPTYFVDNAINDSEKIPITVFKIGADDFSEFYGVVLKNSLFVKAEFLIPYYTGTKFLDANGEWEVNFCIRSIYTEFYSDGRRFSDVFGRNTEHKLVVFSRDGYFRVVQCEPRARFGDEKFAGLVVGCCGDSQRFLRIASLSDRGSLQSASGAVQAGRFESENASKNDQKNIGNLEFKKAPDDRPIIRALLLIGGLCGTLAGSRLAGLGAGLGPQVRTARHLRIIGRVLCLSPLFVALAWGWT
jgi:hypothetical protein